MSKKCAFLVLFQQYQNFLISSLGFFLVSSLNYSVILILKVFLISFVEL